MATTTLPPPSPPADPETTPAAPATPPPAAPGGPAAGSRRRSARGASPRRRLGIVAVLAAVAGIAVAAWFGYRHFAADEADPPPSATPAAEADTDVAGEVDPSADTDEPGADADEPTGVIDETQRLVDDINERPELDEALDALGLDATGAPVPPVVGDESAAEIEPVVSYGFRWSDPFGLSVDVQVDTASGNYLAVTSDGTEIRRVDGRYYGLAANSDWVELSPSVVSGIPVIGIDGLLVDATVVPMEVEPYVLAREIGEGGVERILIDDARLAADDTVLRTQWLGPWGLIDAGAAVAASDPTDAVPDDAGEGQVVISIARDDGLITEVFVSSPAIGGTAHYSLSSTGLFPLPIEAPPV